MLQFLDPAHRLQGIGVIDALVVPLALHSGQPQGHAARVTGAELEVAEGDFHDQFRPHVHGPLIAASWKAVASDTAEVTNLGTRIDAGTTSPRALKRS